MKHLQRRSVDGRHNGADFNVEVREEASGDVSVSEVSVDGVVIGSAHLEHESGMNAALGSGAALARQHIDDSEQLDPVEADDRDGDPF